MMKEYECYSCGSNTTTINKHGYSQWRTNRDLISGKIIHSLCLPCYNHLIWSPPRIEKMSKRRITYKNKRVYTETIPRMGTCVLCNETGIRTHIHHVEYHDNDQLRDTIEICISCHKIIELERMRKKRINERCYSCNILIGHNRYYLNKPTDLIICRRCAYHVLNIERFVKTG